MGLLSFDDLTDTCNRAINAGLSNPPRGALFMGIDNAVKAAIFSNAAHPANALRIEVDQLNQFIDRGSDGYLFEIWLINAANSVAATHSGDAAVFRQRAALISAVPAPAPVTGKETEDLASGLWQEEQDNPQVAQAVRYLRSSMPGMNRRATNLMVSKRLHDALHHIQLHVLPLWRMAAATLSAGPGLAWRTVYAQQRQLKDKAEGLSGEFAFLPAVERLRAIAQKTADGLLDAASAAETARAASDVDALKSAIAKVRGIVREAMPVYAGKMDGYQEGLELSQLLTNLTSLAQASKIDAVKESASRLASSLAAIAQDLNIIGPQHSQWQLLDIRLGTLENWFDFLHFGPSAYSSFNLEWDAINAAIETLASVPPTERLDRVKALRDQFLAECSVPMQAAPSQKATDLFGDFVIELRTVFYEVDVRMKQICNQLREITNQLAQL